MNFKEILYTKQGYSYIKCNCRECYEWGGACICDSCGVLMEKDVYLIYVLAQAFCEECFQEWKERAKRYDDDIKLQDRNHERWYKLHGFKKRDLEFIERLKNEI